MARTLIIQLTLFLLPFLAYAIYRLLVSDAQAEGRKTWPITTLFTTGAVLAVAGWTWMATREVKDPNVCYEAARFEDGEIIPGRTVPCPRDLRDVGQPTTDSPGRPARGTDEIVSDDAVSETPDDPPGPGGG